MKRIKEISDSCIERWGTEDKNTKNLSNKIGKFISQLGDNVETGEILLSLLENYNYYSREKVNNILISFYSKIKELDVPKYRTIYSRIEKDHKINSSSNLLEEFKIINNIGNSFSHDLTKLQSNDLKDIDVIIFMDDIIGSGKTIIKFLKDNKEKLKDKSIIIFVIEIMEDGYINLKEYLKSIGCDHLICFYNKTDKAFSENGVFKEKSSEKRLILHGFEANNVKAKNYVLGFQESEALVSFYRNTPNNTLSSYWYSLNQNWKPLFPRDLDKPDFMKASKGKKNIKYNLAKKLKEKGIDTKCNMI
ncbi:phosphoribosyltransferase-like protein [Clostridium sp. B9]|uniref:phosphoribosyltransferase-like protein n=1 Tax=Clostridium sp. B9 TaxID=3423224 RepID=UPI003D2EC18C